MTSERIKKIINLKGFTKEKLEAEARKRREELIIETEKLERLETLLKETLKKFTQESGPINNEELGLFHEYIVYLERQILKQKKVVQEKKNLLMEKEKEVMTIHREKRLFEILNEGIIKEEKREALLKEQKEMDIDFIMRRLRR